QDRTELFNRMLFAVDRVLESARHIQDEGSIYYNPLVIDDLFTAVYAMSAEDGQRPFETEQRQIIVIAHELANFMQRAQGIRLRVVSEEELVRSEDGELEENIVKEELLEEIESDACILQQPAERSLQQLQQGRTTPIESRDPIDNGYELSFKEEIPDEEVKEDMDRDEIMDDDVILDPCCGPGVPKEMDPGSGSGSVPGVPEEIDRSALGDASMRQTNKRPQPMEGGEMKRMKESGNDPIDSSPIEADKRQCLVNGSSTPRPVPFRLTIRSQLRPRRGFNNGRVIVKCRVCCATMESSELLRHAQRCGKKGLRAASCTAVRAVQPQRLQQPQHHHVLNLQQVVHLQPA
ncbi:hypothetical protein PFISCL1PPCAC_18502, partial [Pristionchus fissidentatus]